MKPDRTLSKFEFNRLLVETLPGMDYENTDNDSNRNIYFTRISMSGLEEMHAYSIDERLYEYLEFEPFKTIEDTKHYLQKLMGLESDGHSEKTAICWFVRKVADDKMIGTARLVDIDYKRQSVVWGYGIDPRLWGKGYIFEIQELLKEYIFEKLCLNRLSGMTMVNNERTKSALLATGCREEGIFRQYYRDYLGKYTDGWMYSILAEDYFLEVKKSDKHIPVIKIDRKIIADIISQTLNEKIIDINDGMHSVDNWDSLSHINIILALEKETGFKFSPSDISHATSINALFKILNSKNIR